MINEIYDRGEILEDLSRPFFLALSKKTDANECEPCGKMSLMSQITEAVN